tara:strand:- start:502 stop:1422 length:921 start_codon:yes stop_codon:yes gene_type:complete
MADRSVAVTDTLETFRTTFNSLAGDIGDIADLQSATGTIASSTDVVEAVTAMNTEIAALKAGTSVFETKIVFEGATDDANETTLVVADPSADRTITLPNLTGTVSLLDATETLTNKTLTAPTLTSAVLNTAVSGSAILDEDNMASDSATQLATQQSIKAFVEAQVTAEDLDITTDSGTIAIDLDSETLTIAGGTGIDTTGSGNTITVAIDSTVATLTGTQTLTNKTLTSPTINSPTITSVTATALNLTDSSIVFEGSTADAHETTLTVTDPTADRTITLPNETGTLITSTSAATNAFSISIAAALG